MYVAIPWETPTLAAIRKTSLGELILHFIAVNEGSEGEAYKRLLSDSDIFCDRGNGLEPVRYKGTRLTGEILFNRMNNSIDGNEWDFTIGEENAS